MEEEHVASEKDKKRKERRRRSKALSNDDDDDGTLSCRGRGELPCTIIKSSTTTVSPFLLALLSHNTIPDHDRWSHVQMSHI